MWTSGLIDMNMYCIYLQKEGISKLSQSRTPITFQKKDFL